MLQALVEKITVYPDGKIEILWKFRDELNQDRNKKMSQYRKLIV